MNIKIGDIFRYYKNDELWLGAVRHRTQDQISVEWLLPIVYRGLERSSAPSLRLGQIMLFDRALNA